MSYGRGQQKPGAPSQGASSLQDRFKEMSAQEKLIEQKKKEIELKLLEQKRKAQVEAISKMQAARSSKKPETGSLLSRWVFLSRALKIYKIRNNLTGDFLVLKSKLLCFLVTGLVYDLELHWDLVAPMSRKGE